MAGSGNTLGREWHVAAVDFHTRQIQENPNDLGAIFEERFAQLRLVAYDISAVFGGKAKGILSDGDFMLGLNDLKRQFQETGEVIEHAFEGRRVYVKNFPNAPTDRQNAIVDATDPNFLLAGELWPWNMVRMDFWALSVMFKSQLLKMDPTVNVQEVVGMALLTGKMYETLQSASHNPKAVVLGFQGIIGVAAAAMPRDEKHVMWARRKYAEAETYGYVMKHERGVEAAYMLEVRH